MNNAITKLVFDVVNADADNMWNSMAPTRINIKTPWIYLITVSVGFAYADANITSRQAGIMLNGTDTIALTKVGSSSSGSTFVIATVSKRLNKGDYIECIILQVSGSAITTSVYSGLPNIQVIKVGD